MAKYINEGKRFEEDFKNSAPDYLWIHRLRDSAQSFNKNKDTNFAWDNECDFFAFDDNARILYCLELKSTKYKSISYQMDENDNSSRMIKWHQIESLTKFSKFKNIKSGLILNFRDEKNDMQRTYFMDIRDFNKVKDSNDKHSINEIDIVLNGGVKISGSKKRVRYRWELDSFLKTMSENNNS